MGTYLITLVGLLFVFFSYAAAYDPLDPNGNITIKWDVMSWTPDGYVAVVTMNNFQMYRHIMTPGWTLGWTWAKKEVIWTMIGAQATEQGDCSKFKGNVPHCCKKTPTILDMLPGVPYNQQFTNCCKGGVLASWGQDPQASVSAFQVSVGQGGTSNKTVKLPKNFTLLGPGPGYTCGPAKIVPSTKFFTPDLRRKTQALMTWNVTCTYSQFVARKHPSCCVSLSTFYNETITTCPSCACGCENKHKCIKSDSKLLSVVGVNTPRKDNAPLLQCTQHMCPVRIHWHVKLNYKEYWRVKITITNFNYRVNYTQWTLVAQHPNLNNVTQVFSFDYKPLVPYQSISKSLNSLQYCIYLTDELAGMVEKNRLLEAEKVGLSQDNAHFSSRLGELETIITQLRGELDLVKNDAVNMAERHRLLESESAKYKERMRVSEQKVEDRARICDELKTELEETAEANDLLRVEFELATQIQGVLDEER
ncbi:COBRA-like protein 4 [Lycium ferocissimum]|uniref:COBRA-like protein 4 n=1 Tax=Lycium ferocissimum TaxID=112874 RepID=UPI0028153B64|nr:COBRA-like protein 4 [Lycium ferocissimum]